MKFLLILLLGLLAGCEPIPKPIALRLVNVESGEAPGLSLRELPPQALSSLGLPYGLVVVRTGGAAERAGLKVGDVVYGVNQKKIGSLKEFRELLAQPADGKLALLVRRGKTDFYFAMDPKGAPVRETLLRT